MLLEAKEIHKSYLMGKGDVLEVLKGISLTIKSGEIIAVVGPSGAGKSTLLHTLGALDRPTKGHLHMEGTDVFKLSDSRLAQFRNRYIGFVFQFHHLLPDFTALENVAIPGMMEKMNRSDAFKQAETLLGEVGLSDRLQHRPNELSGGEQQRVAFARSLINDPALVLADEPSGNLDTVNSASLHDAMWRMVRDLKKTFVVVTHNDDLAGKADRVIRLSDGRIAGK